MIILHCCLSEHFVDNYGYQENIITKMHKMQGYDVRIVASTETIINNKLCYLAPSKYIGENNIPIIRIPYTKLIPAIVSHKLRIYKNIKKTIINIHPDIIFIHGLAFLSIISIADYAKKNKSIVYVDNHDDYINSCRNWFSKIILHKLIYKQCAKKIEPYVKWFYGVLPIRVDFLIHIYNVPKDKTKLLLMGADDSLFNIKEKHIVRHQEREKLRIKDKDFIIVSGGKIEKRKNIDVLIKAFNMLNIPNVRLIIFGKVDNNLKDEFSQYQNCANIIFTGFLNQQQIYDILISSDLAIYPGTHSVLWEQSVGVGLPCIFKKWEGIQHVDLGGNCLFLDDITIETIKNILIRVIEDKDLFFRLRKHSIEKGIKMFSYSKIAKQAIEEC
jgi:1,2-diacylglycerol 3-alpha-glucosyltransferase